METDHRVSHLGITFVVYANERMELEFLREEVKKLKALKGHVYLIM